MTKAVYLRRLGRCLQWYYGPTEAEEVLADYREFFAAGIADGESEEALCRRFGSPGAIVRELAAGKKLSIFVGRLVLAGSLLGVLLTSYLLGIFRGYSMFPHISVAADTAVYTILALMFPVLLWFLLGGNLVWASASPRPRGARLVLVLSFLAFVLAEALIYGFYTAGAAFTPERGFWFFGLWLMDVDSMSRASVVILVTGVILLLTALAACLVCFVRGYCAVFPVVCLLIGALSSLAKAGYTIYQLDEPSHLFIQMCASFVPLAAGIVMALLFQSILRERSRKERMGEEAAEE